MTTTPQAALLSESAIVACIAKAGCIGTVKMSYESGPYGIYRPSINASRLYDAIEAAILAKLQATQAEPVQEGELPPLPEPAHRGPTGTGAYFNSFTADQMHAYARAALAARKPLTRKQINEASRDAQISFCLKTGGTYEEELARAIERAHGIGLEVKP